jgi:hypothetical protein
MIPSLRLSKSNRPHSFLIYIILYNLYNIIYSYPKRKRKNIKEQEMIPVEMIYKKLNLTESNLKS